MTKCFAIFLTLLFLTAKSWGGEFPNFYRGIRQMGMGGVVVATVNDETALLSNAAGMGKLRDVYATVADPELTYGVKVSSLATTNPSAVTDAFAMLEYLNEHPTESLYTKAQIFPSIVLKNFGFGFFGKQERLGFIDTDDEEFKYNYTYDLAFALGYTLRMWEGRIKLGLSGRAINRVQMKESFDTDVTVTTEIDPDLYTKEGFGVAGDVSLLLTAPWTFLPSIGAVVRDAGGTKFNVNGGYLTDAEERPESVLQTIDAGFSITPILGNYTRLQIAADYRDATNVYKDERASKRIHGGMELNFNDTLFLRAGVNQSYWTAGLELTFGYFQLQIASYGEDIGSETAREDRRYVGKLAFRF